MAHGARRSSQSFPNLPGFPDNIQPWLVQVVSAMTCLAVVAVTLRVASRRIRKQKLWWDDGMIIFSMLWNLVVVGFIFAMYSAGMGIHANLVDPEEIVKMAKWLVVAEILYAWNLGWTKLSVLLMYYRIFHVPYFKKMAWCVGAFVMAWVVCIMFLFVFICVPVQKLWYPDLPGHCINQVGTWIANAASTIFTDLVILLMPIPQIWRLQLRTTEKIGLTFAFSLGFFVVFASAYRTSVLFTYTNADPTYTLAPTVGWTAIEMSAGIVSACLPTLLPVLRLFARSLGIKRNSLSPNRAGSSDTNPSTGDKSNMSGGPGQRTSANTLSGAESTRKTSSSAFYRLADETGSDGSFTGTSDLSDAQQAAAADAKLRPDTKGYKHTVKSFTTHRSPGGETRDDIPLHGIRVQTDFEQSMMRR